MSNIPIAQGFVVSGDTPYGKAPQAEAVTATHYQQQQPYAAQPVYDATSGNRPAAQHQFQDVFWSLLFFAHLIAIVAVVAINLQASGMSLQQGGSYGNIVFMVSVTALSSVAMATFALSFMMRNSQTLVQMALIFSICSSLAVGILGFMFGNLLMGIVGLISFLFGLCYAKLVWPRIPFAAANLTTALTAVRSNLGIAIVAYLFTAVAFGWTVFWMLGLGNTLSSQNMVVVFLLFVSYYWVHQVLQNLIHVTTAGVVGTWWFVPDEASTCCSRAISDSLFRATTYSFGSICFGSLLVAIVQALRALEYYSRDNEDFQFLSCIVQCILSCLESIIEEINKFAYVYVGLYGFSFLEAGRNVFQLFEQKGWNVIITDDLSDNVLMMMSLAVGLASGLIGLVFGAVEPNMFVNLGMDHAAGPGFLIGLLTGFLIATVLFSVVGSAVNTVIVCFAEAPAEFQQNHPELSHEMRAAWTTAWPDLFG